MGSLEYEIGRNIIYKAATESPEGNVGLYSCVPTMDYLKNDVLNDYTPMKMYKKPSYDTD